MIPDFLRGFINRSDDTRKREAREHVRQLTLQRMPWDELDRNHRQAIVCVRESLRHGDAEVYHRAAGLEESYREEKKRRQRDRYTPEGVCVRGYR